MEIISQQSWRSTLRATSDLAKSHILELIVRHIGKDPYYKPKALPPNHKIVEDYLSKTRTKTEITIQKVIHERRAGRIERLLQEVFGTTAVSRMRNYTDKANLAFAKKMLGGYVHVAPINYLKAFLLDYLKSEVKVIVDLLLIRGQWSTTLISQQLSDSFHNLIEMTDNLLEFDESLSEDGEAGTAIFNALHKADRDKGMVKVVRQYLSEINGQALRMLRNAAHHLIAVAKHLKVALDDYKAKPAELIINWREIDSAFAGDFSESITRIYKRIYSFIQLLRFYIKQEGS